MTHDPTLNSDAMSLADSTAFFDGSRLTLARHLSGLRKNALADKIGRTPTAIGFYENGTKKPTSATVAKLAMALQVEPSFFVVRSTGAQVICGVPHFRSLRSTSQAARDQAYSYGVLTVDIATTLERHLEFPCLDLPRYTNFGQKWMDLGPEEAAIQLRRAWQLPDGPVGHLVRLAENHGIIVVFSPPQAVSVDAYSIDSSIRPAILLNPIKRDYFRQRWDLAHELGHLVMHPDSEPGGKIVEEEANRFAAELLLPAAEMSDDLPARADWHKFYQLKEHWRVSLQALLYRARRLGAMTDVTYRNAMTTLSARGWRRREPGAMPTLEHPSLLPRSVEILASELGVSELLLARECNVPITLFRQVTSRTPGSIESTRETNAASRSRRGKVDSVLSSIGPS